MAISPRTSVFAWGLVPCLLGEPECSLGKVTHSFAMLRVRGIGRVRLQAGLTTMGRPAPPSSASLRGIRRHGEFFPFAGVVGADGELRMVAVQMDEERPQSAAVIEELYRVLAPEAESGAIRAAGVCMDVLMTPPGGRRQMP
jgi:hypothetical protein